MRIRVIKWKNSIVLLSFRNKNLSLEPYFLIMDYSADVSNPDSLTVLHDCVIMEPFTLPTVSDRIRLFATIVSFTYKMVQLIK